LPVLAGPPPTPAFPHVSSCSLLSREALARLSPNIDRGPAATFTEATVNGCEWFQGQGTRLPVIPEAAGGLELVGARYCTLLDRRVAHLYYSNGDHHLSLFLVPGPVRDLSRERRPRGNVVRLLRVGGTTVGLVSEEEDSVEAFRRALSTTLARNFDRVDRSSP